MLHIVPILCLIFYIFFEESRLKRHVNQTETHILSLQNKIHDLEFKIDIIKEALTTIEDNKYRQ